MRKTPKSPIDFPKSYGTSAIARLCGISSATAAKWIDDGQIHAHLTIGKHRRVTQKDLVAFMRAHGFPIPPELEVFRG